MERVFTPPIYQVTFGISPQLRESTGYTVGSPVGGKFSHFKVSSITLDGESIDNNPGSNTIIRIWVLDPASPDKNEMLFRTFINLPAAIIYDMDKT